FAAMNLKKLATWLWKGKEPLFFCSKFRKKSDKKTSQTQITSSRRLLSTVCAYRHRLLLLCLLYQMIGGNDNVGRTIERWAFQVY
ncbi:hypothetical protein P7D47_12525, partial [Enterococcus avium]|nr:hypothetical protein [Enterococcus avium]